MMLCLSVAFVVSRIKFLKFRQQFWGKSLIYEIVSELSHDAGPIDFHALPLPPAKAKHLLVELIGKAFRPCCQFFAKECVENGLQGLLVADFLVPGSLVDQGSNADNRKAAIKNLCRLRNMELVARQSPSILSVHVDVAGHGQYVGLISECDISPVTS